MLIEGVAVEVGLLAAGEAVFGMSGWLGEGGTFFFSWAAMDALEVSDGFGCRVELLAEETVGVGAG